MSRLEHGLNKHACAYITNWLWCEEDWKIIVSLYLHVFNAVIKQNPESVLQKQFITLPAVDCYISCLHIFLLAFVANSFKLMLLYVYCFNTLNYYQNNFFLSWLHYHVFHCCTVYMYLWWICYTLMDFYHVLWHDT